MVRADMPRDRSKGRSDAAGRLGQAGDLARLLGRAVWEQLVEVLAVALVRPELLADRLGQHAHRRGDLVLVVVVAKEVDDLPVAGGHLDVLDLCDVGCGFRRPVGEVPVSYTHLTL